MGLLTSRLQAALLATLGVACATQLDENVSDLESEGGGANMAGTSGSGAGGSTPQAGSTSGKGGTAGSPSSGGSAGSSSGGKGGTTSSGGSAGASAGSGGSSAGSGGNNGGTAGSGGSSAGSGGKAGSGSGGVVSTGDCDEPSEPSRATAACGDTIIYNNKLYTCISQAVNVNGEPTGCNQDVTPGVYCSQIDPDNVAFGAQAWMFVEDC